MSVANDFDGMAYAARIMKSVGFDTEANDEFTDIFELQWPSWQDLFNRHRIGDDLSKAEQLLTTFMRREFNGGATRVLAAFAKHLDAQPKQGGSPDWSAAGREWAECCYCDGRGIVSMVPCRTVNWSGDDETRHYSFACVCDAARRFPGVKVAEDWMLRFAADRKQAEIAGHEAKLRRYGIDPKADGATRARQFRRAIGGMLEAVASGKVTAKLVQPILPKTVEEARSILADRRRRTSPPEKLNPERVALAVYGNGDERNEWE